mmetsp:Transcript_8637/g.12538  ORF Transcript_8637/g.12538 Transcript_8637/m.12538 type:complete len:244 (+) Transcript_8637:886-1617(+)
MVQIIIRISGTVTSAVSAEIVAFVFSIVTLTSRLYTVIDVHMWSKLSMFTECDGCFLKFFLEWFADFIGWDGPEFILDTGIWVGQCPGHFNTDVVVGLKLCLDRICVFFEHKERGNCNISARTIVSHNGFVTFTFLPWIGCAEVSRSTQTSIIGNNNSRSSCALCVSHFLDECAPTAIDHEDVWSWPWDHFTTAILATNRIPPVCVYSIITEFRIGVVNALLQTGSVRRNTEQCFTMLITTRL